MKNLTSRKVRSMFMLSGVAAMMGATMMVPTAARADKEKDYKVGATALGILGAVLAVKGKTLPAVIAGAGAYYAYEKGKDAKNDSYYDNQYNDNRWNDNRYDQNDNRYNSNDYYGNRYDNNNRYDTNNRYDRNANRYGSNDSYGNRYDNNNNRNDRYDQNNRNNHNDNRYNGHSYSVR